MKIYDLHLGIELKDRSIYSLVGMILKYLSKIHYTPPIEERLGNHIMWLTRSHIFLSMLIFTMMGNFLYADERTVIINTSEYKFRIHTTYHSAPLARKTVLVMRKDEDFTNSFFIDVGLDGDKEAFSTLIYLMANCNKIEVRYDDQVTAPWGDTRVHAITTLESMDGSLGN